MAYDQTTYGASPFVQGGDSMARTEPVQKRNAAKPEPARRRDAAKPKPPDADALSDQLGEIPTDQSPKETRAAAGGSPALPDEPGLAVKSRCPEASVFRIPSGRLGGLNLVGEALGWLMAWGTVGFFRAYLPAPVVSAFDYIFTPWGMAGGTLISALLIGQLLNRYRVKIGALRRMAIDAIEYGEAMDRAKAQSDIDRLLTEAAEKTESVSRWLVSWLTALGCLFIIGAFY